MVSIGIVGVGFMGMIHYLAARKLKGARVTAICSRDPKKLAGDWRGIRGNFGPPGEKMDLSKVKKYDHLDALLDDPEIDLVDICYPTHLHAPTAMAALKAGKHVLGLVCGVPGKVVSSGLEEGGSVQYLTTEYLYGEDGPAVSCSSGALAMKGRPFVHGYEIYLERATLIYESGTTPLTLLTADGRQHRPKLKGGGEATTAFTSEIQAAVDGIQTGQEPEF